MITISWVDETTRSQPTGGDSFDISFSFIQLDILENENYESRAEVTQHAVEEGIPVNDHLVQQSDRITLTGIVSDRQSSTQFVRNARYGTTTLRDGTEISGVVIPEGTDRRGDVFDQLLQLKLSGTRVTVDGLQRPIDEWVIESISAPRSVNTAGTLVCNISLVEVRTAVLEEIDAPSPRVERGRSGSSAGTAETDDANPTEQAQTQKARSILKSSIDRITGGS